MLLYPVTVDCLAVANDWLREHSHTFLCLSLCLCNCVIVCAASGARMVVPVEPGDCLDCLAMSARFRGVPSEPAEYLPNLRLPPSFLRCLHVSGSNRAVSVGFVPASLNVLAVSWLPMCCCLTAMNSQRCTSNCCDVSYPCLPNPSNAVSTVGYVMAPGGLFRDFG